MNDPWGQIQDEKTIILTKFSCKREHLENQKVFILFELPFAKTILPEASKFAKLEVFLKLKKIKNQELKN